MHILIADDDNLCRKLLSAVLSDASDLVLELAADGTEALALIRASQVPFDLLLTDIDMPGANGWQVAEMARRRNPCTRVVILSAGEQASRAASAGYGFLQKPLDLDHLECILEGHGVVLAAPHA